MDLLCGCSSVVRALPCQGRGRELESLHPHQICLYVTSCDVFYFRESKLNLAPWRSGYAAVCKTVYTGSNPVGASKETWASGGIGIRDGLKIRWS